MAGHFSDATTVTVGAEHEDVEALGDVNHCPRNQPIVVWRGSAEAHFTETPTRSPRSMASCSRRMNSRNACALPLKSSQLTARPAFFFKGVGFLAQSRILAGHPCLTKPNKHANSE
jgi:hypothetical protein